MLSEHTVAEAAEAAGLPVRATYVPVTGSTNTDAWRLGEEGAPEWHLVVAGRQEAGRGRLGRTWLSLPGTSLHLSVLLRPTLPPDEAALLSLAAAVAMAEACRSGGGVGVRCKWPNDLVVSDRKLGGILTEASVVGERVTFVVIGVGVNVTQTERDFPEKLRSSATSLAREGGRPDAVGVLRDWLSGLRALYGEGGRGLGGRTLEPYRGLCATIGRRVRASTVDREIVEGVARAVGEGGELLVETGGGLRAVEFGEVAHLN